MAFYDPDTPGPVRARGWLITVQQLADLITQEMHDEPGSRPDLEHQIDAIVRRSARRAVTPSAPGATRRWWPRACLEGTPVVTFTARRAHLHHERTQPSRRYLATIAAGLSQVGHGHGFPRPVL